MSDAAALADELVELMFDAEPLRAALLGVDPERPGLGDLGVATEQTYRRLLLDLLTRARAVDRTRTNRQDDTTLDVVIAHAQATVDHIDTRVVEFTVSDIFVSPAVGLLTVLPMLNVDDDRQGYAQLERLAAIPAYLEQALDRHRAGVADGLFPVAHLVRAAIAHLDRYLADPAADPLTRQRPPSDDFARRREQLLTDTVRPAFAVYRNGLVVDIEPHGRPEERPGLCWLPDGERVYATLARTHTTTDRGPEELHRTGLELIEQLAGEYREIGLRVFGTSNLSEIFHRLREDPALRWRDGDELLSSARAAIARAERVAPAWFGRIPPHQWVVEPVPEAEAPGGPAAYYMKPSVDGSRPGTYFANTYQAHERFRHTCEATAFHEAVPGHHFQLSTALGLDQLPMLRRIAGFTAYAEGWGLYTERLADEMGLYSDDVALLGMLTMDSTRAARLVIDTGLHALGWSRAQAVTYMRDNTPMPPVEIESEVDRYIVFPGQALAYMVGRLEIQRIRAEAERVLADRFDIREFHDIVLGGGELPMSVLSSVVARWTEDRQAEPQRAEGKV